MGLLGALLEHVEAGARIRMVWTLQVPRESGGTTLDDVVIHDDDPTENDVRSVIDAGEREVWAYNVSLAEPGKLEVGQYQFVVANPDGLFYTATTGNYFYNSTGSYQADPQECFVNHQLYVRVGGYWIEASNLAYIGKIESIKYHDTGRADGVRPLSATIITRNSGISEILKYIFTEEDGDDVDTGINIYLP